MPQQISLYVAVTPYQEGLRVTCSYSELLRALCQLFPLEGIAATETREEVFFLA